MTFKEKVLELLNQGLALKPDIFLIDLSISDANKITILIDGDNGVVLQDCIDVSRSIDNNLDREEQDFSLEVASVGVGSVLKLHRQYLKNIGRTLIVKTVKETIEAELIEVAENFIILSWQAREAKKIGKGKETVVKTQQFLFEDIVQAVVTVNFN
ncbi:MAG: ribosome assembly cofactor RimP [Flavobacterium sp.]|nr:ribosome assembly cofactor RimP [Flavobacterium sp.]